LNLVTCGHFQSRDKDGKLSLTNVHTYIQTDRIDHNYKACCFLDASKFEDFHESGLAFTLKNTGKHVNKDRDTKRD